MYLLTDLNKTQSNNCQNKRESQTNPLLLFNMLYVLIYTYFQNIKYLSHLRKMSIMVAFGEGLLVKRKKYFLSMIKNTFFCLGWEFYGSTHLLNSFSYQLKSLYFIAFKFYLNKTSKHCLVFYIMPYCHLPHLISDIYMFYFPVRIRVLVTILGPIQIINQYQLNK